MLNLSAFTCQTSKLSKEVCKDCGPYQLWRGRLDSARQALSGFGSSTAVYTLQCCPYLHHTSLDGQYHQQLSLQGQPVQTGRMCLPHKDNVHNPDQATAVGKEGSHARYVGELTETLQTPNSQVPVRANSFLLSFSSLPLLEDYLKDF